MGVKRNSKLTSKTYNVNDNKKNSSTSTGVVLNVYDLTPLNNYFYWFGLGIFHSGIEIHGKEYGFGAHDFPASGVFEVEPKKCPGFTYRRSINLGQVDMHRSEFRTFIENMANEYHGDTYHLIHKNCNHFTGDVSCRLIGKKIPSWVNRLAKLGSLCSCLLPESLQATTVKQLPEYSEFSDDEVTESPSTVTPFESLELNDAQEQRLLSPKVATDDVSFVKGATDDVSFVKEALVD